MNLEVSEQYILDMLKVLGVEGTKEELKSMWNSIVDDNIKYYEELMK